MAWLRGAVVAVGVGVSATPLLYFVALLVHPTTLPDGHRVMPIGQVGFAILVGPLLGVIAGVAVARRRPG